MADKRLIPISIASCGKGTNKWIVGIDEEEPFEVECTADQLRKATLRMKCKDGDGKIKCRSSKNGTYRSMFSDEDDDIHTVNVWKSKCPKNCEEFKSLLESSRFSETIKNFGDFLDLIEETLFVEYKNVPLDLIDKVLDDATENEELLKSWENFTNASDDKFNKREQMFWNAFDKFFKKYEKEFETLNKKGA